jgi:hypothetical protein
LGGPHAGGAHATSQYQCPGNNDGRTSKYFEDIIYVLENRFVIWKEIDGSSGNLKRYLKTE